MIFFDPSHIIVKPQRRLYVILRAVLALAAIALVGCVLHSAIFRSEAFSYRFADPRSGSLEKPRSESGATFQGGSVAGGSTVVTYVGVPGSSRLAEITIRLRPESQKPPGFPVTIRRSHRSFFLPAGDPVDDFPKERVFVVGESLYLWTPDGRLFPMVSERAALSRFPGDRISRAGDDLLQVFPPSDRFAAYRVGSLVSHGDTVYQVLPGDRIRPFWNRETFVALGYDWDDILPLDDREFSGYRVDSLFRPGSAQPDGTVFEDTDDGSLSVVEADFLRPVTDTEYERFLASVAHPIKASSAAASVEADCVADRGLLGSTMYRCRTTLSALRSSPGSSYRISFPSDADIVLDSIEAEFYPSYSEATLRSFIDRFMERLSRRYER